MEKIVVREYEDTCKDEIIDLILEIQQKEFGIAVTKEDQPDLNAVGDFYRTGDGNFWVALCDGRVVGTIALKDIGHRQAALRKMFVKAGFRGGQYGTARLLLERLLEWARERGVTDIFLGTTDRFTAAHRFYEKNGFVRIPMDGLPENFPVMKIDTVFYRLPCVAERGHQSMGNS